MSAAGEAQQLSDASPKSEIPDEAEITDAALLSNLVTAAIESVHGEEQEIGRPWCYTPVFGFKNQATETAFKAFHAQTALTGSVIFALFHLLYLGATLVRLLNVVRGTNTIRPTPMIIYFFIAIGTVALSGLSYRFYFAGQAVRKQAIISPLITAMGLLSASGWLAQFYEVFHNQHDWSVETEGTFVFSYWFGMLGLLGPVLGIWMRVPFYFCMPIPFLFGGTAFNTIYSSTHYSAFALVCNASLQVCTPLI